MNYTSNTEPQRDTHLVQEYSVRTYECGQDGFILLSQLCNYLQEAASVHADILGLSKDVLAGYNLTWVLARMRVRVDRYPKWRDEVHVLTFPHKMGKLTAQRDFVLMLQDGSNVGAASSEWMCLDLAKRRAARLPDIMGNCANNVRTPVWPGNAFTKPVYPDNPVDETEKSFEVYQTHIDLNGHVNNVRYIEWMMECAPETATDRKVREMEIVYRAEAFLGETVIARCAVLPDGTRAHRVLAPSRDLIIARTKWQDMKNEHLF